MNIDFVFLQALQQAKNDQAKPTQPSENMLSFKIRHALLIGIRIDLCINNEIGKGDEYSNRLKVKTSVGSYYSSIYCIKNKKK